MLTIATCDLPFWDQTGNVGSNENRSVGENFLSIIKLLAEYDSP